MDSAFAQWEKESSTPDEEWAALHQVVYNTVETYFASQTEKPRAGSTPTIRIYILLCTEETNPTRVCCKPGALDPPLQLTKMP